MFEWFGDDAPGKKTELVDKNLLRLIPKVSIAWSESITGDFDPKEMEKIRDNHFEELADEFTVGGRSKKAIRVIIELAGHGNLKKSALLARKLEELHPENRLTMNSILGKVETEVLLTHDIMKLPSDPQGCKTILDKYRSLSVKPRKW